MADCYLGEIRLFAGVQSAPPAGWMFCNGDTLSVSTYQALFALIGATYGGDGVNNFKLPELRGRAPIHVGQGTGLANRVLGQADGAETVTVGITEIPAHNHTFNVSGDGATNPLPNGLVLANPSPREFYTTVPQPTIPDQVLKNDTVTMAGGNQPHENRMPSIALRYIIAINGLFPNFQ